MFVFGLAVGIIGTVLAGAGILWAKRQIVGRDSVKDKNV